jgi:hypothetical protein
MPHRKIRRASLDGVERKAMLQVRSAPVSVLGDKSLFAPRKTRPQTYAIQPQDTAFGSWEAALSDVVQASARKCSDNEILVLDLSDLVEGNPRMLAKGVRMTAQALARMRERKPTAPRLAVRWRYREAEISLRTGFALAWEMMDRDAPATRTVVPWRAGSERGLSVLGHLPPTLATRVERLQQHRLLTFHSMMPTPHARVSPTLQKDCLRLLKRFQDFGLVVDRGYASGNDEVELGLVETARDRGRVKIYESVVAAAAGMREPSV